MIYFYCPAWPWKVKLGFLFHGRVKNVSYSRHLGPKSPRKIIFRVLEKYVRLVAVTFTSSKVDVAASKLFPRKEKWGPRGLKKCLKQLIILWSWWLVLLRKNFFFYYFFVFFKYILVTGRMLG